MKIFFVVLILMMNTAAYATAWPVVTSPTKEILTALHLIDVSSCPEGSGKIVPYAEINIERYLCKTFCPSDWRWVSSETTCHNLTTEFNLQNYQIDYVRDGEGTVDHSVVTANYGSPFSKKPAFQLTFSTPSGEHWYCFEMNSTLHTITCANDI